MMYTAETVISIFQIPLQLKLLHPWNRGIHGYIRSHVKGCLSVFLFSSSPHLFPHSSFEKEITVPPQGFRQLWFWLCKWDLQWIVSIILMKIDWLLNISELWMQTILHLSLPLWLLREGIADFVQFSRYRGCRLNFFVGASPSMTYLQSSEKPVTLTTHFYHSSPIATLSHSRNQMCLKCILLKVLHYNSR